MDTRLHTRLHTQVTADWHRWIRDSLTAGNAPADLLVTMKEHDFDPQAARAAIADAVFGAEMPVSVTPRGPALAGRLADGHRLAAYDREVRVLARIARPVIAVLDGVLDDGECAALRAMATPRLARSAVVSPESGADTIIDSRTSEGAYFQRAENELIQRIDRRAAAIMRMSEEQGEGLQVMRYGTGGEYEPHYDYFPPHKTGSRLHLRQGGQRVSTLIMYLDDVEAGGETIFPRVDFSYVPRRGQALYFEYTAEDGSLDPLTLHGGAPVTRGEKWIVTKWMRQHAFVG